MNRSTRVAGPSTRHPLVVVACLALLLSLLGSALDTTAQQATETPTLGDTQGPLAQQDDSPPNETPTDVATEEPTQTGTEEPTEIGTEVPAQTETALPSESRSGPAVAATNWKLAIVDARKFVCPTTFDRESEFDTYFEECTSPLGGVTFTLLDGDGTFTAITDDEYGLARFFEVPPRADGTVQIVEEELAGYAEPVVFCRDSRAGGWVRQTVVDYGVTIDGESATENILSCYFFNFPTGGVSGDVNLAMVALRCPAGFDWATRSVDDCAAREGGVEFELTGTSGTFTATTGGATEVDAVFRGLAPGDYTITMTPPAGIAHAFLWACVQIGVPSEAPSAPLATGATHTQTFVDSVPEGVDYVCQWYLVPSGDDDTGTVHVSKYTCPEGVERTEEDYILSEMCRESVDPVSFTLVATAGGYERTDVAASGVPQLVTFADVPFGEIAIEEAVPPGYGHPLVFCADTASDGPGAYLPVEPWPESGAFIVEHRAEAEVDLSCIFFNFPEDDDPGNSVTVNKYVCPSWVNPETDVLLDACAPGGDGIAFAFVDGNGRHDTPVSGGSVVWSDVVIGVEGELQIIEDIPAGYGDPWVVCDGILMASAGGFVIPNPGDARPFHVECDWFNIALEDASLAVVKHTCEPRYDLHAAGADPMVDCPELADGVDFRIAGMGADMTSTTGDAGPGTVQFGGLDPGAYTLTETVPSGTAASFVLDCFGNDLGAVRPYPLASGATLDLTIHAGEEITCHWFNVPKIEGGALTVVKYLCTGDAYASEVDCQIQESGVTFDLLVRDGDTWVAVDTATTDSHGRIAWVGLAPGRYWLDEHDAEWCHIASPQLTGDATGIAVGDGDESVVKVYNCGAEPGKPGETPEKFPDTGVPPAGGGAPTAALAGLLALPLTRRRLAALVVAPAAGRVAHAVAQDEDQVIEPADGTAGPGTVPGSLCLPSSDGGCERGPVPETLRIDAIGVDAPVEILETVAGEMQQPTDEAHVAWYKETGRLGEPGNMLLAGHLNWWGVPEAVFYNLARLQVDDEIAIAGAEGEPSLYAVEWVRQLPAGEAPGGDVLGMTAWPAATLITCAGAWDAAASTYEERTVVRARLVEVA